MGVYSLVQYSPEPGRQERLNVGIIAAGPQGVVLRFADRDDVDGGVTHRFHELLESMSVKVRHGEYEEWLSELAVRRFSGFAITEPSYFDETVVGADELLRRFVVTRQPA